MKSFIAALFLLISFNVCSQAELRHSSKQFNRSFGQKKWWYKNSLTDLDGDGDYGSQHVDSLFQKSQPSGYVSARPIFLTQFDCNDNNSAINHSATEICNGVDDNCNGLVDDGLTFITYYADADGDHHGNPNVSLTVCNVPAGYVRDNTDCNDSDATIYSPLAYHVDRNGDGYNDNDSLFYFCTNHAPSGYVNNPQPTDSIITLTTTGMRIDTLFYGVLGENMYVDQSGHYRDVNSGTYYASTSSCGFRLISFPGTSQGHYWKSVAGDNSLTTPTGKGGYNPIATTNALAYYNVQFPTNFFAQFLQFAQSNHQSTIIAIPQVASQTQFLNALAEVVAKVPLAGIQTYWEFNNPNWNSCVMCANGTAVRDSGNRIIAYIANKYSNLFYTTDWDGFSYTSNYTKTVFQTAGSTDTRIYYSEHLSTGITINNTINQCKDSMDLSIIRFPNTVNAMYNANGRGVALASWYSDGAAVGGGQYASANTWLQPYYESGLLFAFMDYQVAFPNRLHYCLWGRYDRLLNPDNTLNQQGKLFNLVAPVWHGAYTYNLASFHGLDSRGYELNGHGFVIIRNPNGLSYPIKYVNDNGYITPIQKINALYSTGLGDTNPNTGQVFQILPYSISLVNF